MKAAEAEIAIFTKKIATAFLTAFQFGATLVIVVNVWRIGEWLPTDGAFVVLLCYLAIKPILGNAMTIVSVPEFLRRAIVSVKLSVTCELCVPVLIVKTFVLFFLR